MELTKVVGLLKNLAVIPDSVRNEEAAKMKTKGRKPNIFIVDRCEGSQKKS